MDWQRLSFWLKPDFKSTYWKLNRRPAAPLAPSN
jgi:hypothetical protein